MDDIIFCATIGVDCIKNDWENIERGEPKYLGFVFYVKREETENMMEFIKETLENFHVPYEDIYVYNSISMPIVRVSDKGKIFDTIERSAKYLIEKSHSKSK